MFIFHLQYLFLMLCSIPEKPLMGQDIISSYYILQVKSAGSIFQVSSKREDFIGYFFTNISSPIINICLFFTKIEH